jgi:hypothetical protein
MRDISHKLAKFKILSIGGCLHSYIVYNLKRIWQKPSGQLTGFDDQYPALAGFFNVRLPKHITINQTSPAMSRANFCTEEQMITKERPATRSLEELQEIARRIKQEIEDDKARTRHFLAELFLKGPDAWPDVQKP